MKLVLALVVLCSSVIASAQSRIISIDAFDLSYTGGLLIKSDEGRKVSDKEETTFKLNLNYAQNLEQYVGLMWKAQVYINRQDVDWGSNDQLNSRWGAAGGLLYNFQPDDIKNSFMASGSLGLERQSVEYGGADDESGFNLFMLLEGGKRFELGQYAKSNITYAPTLSFQWMRYGGGIRSEYFKSGTEFKINFLKFDVLF
jgi:hypothetical protein